MPQQLDPNKIYVACAIATKGHRHWSRPLCGNNCDSMGTKRTMVEELGLFLIDMAYDLRLCQTIEVYELSAPILTMQLRDSTGRLTIEQSS